MAICLDPLLRLLLGAERKGRELLWSFDHDKRRSGASSGRTEVSQPGPSAASITRLAPAEPNVYRPSYPSADRAPEERNNSDDHKRDRQNFATTGHFSNQRENIQ